MTKSRCTGLLAGTAIILSTLLPAPGVAAGTEPGAVRPAPTHDFLEAAFELFLGRAPTSGELGAWSMAAHRDGRSTVTRALAASDEWAGRRVDELYRAVLDRPADAAGRAHWVAKIADGLHLEHVAAHFYGSAEHFARVGGSPEAFIDALYVQLLGRPSDPGGRAHWLRHLATGMPRHAVAASFYASTESRRDRVAARFHEVLGRSPDPGGHDHWATRLLSVGEVELAAALAASPEYHRRTTGLPAPTVTLAPVGPATAYPLTHSWRPGCPVHHRDLVAVEFPHHRDDGRVAAGTLIVHRAIAGDVAVVARALYGTGFPLTGARPVDDFGGSDDRSMEADNSSAFNCRTVAGTSTWSEHAHGRAVDLNPRRNPYVSGSRVDPPGGAGWLDRDDVRPGMVVAGAPVVDTFLTLGWGWGGHWADAKDYQHFSTTGR